MKNDDTKNELQATAWMKRGSTGLFILLLALVIILAFLPIPTTVKVDARLTALQPYSAIRMPMEGHISQIHVQDSQYVQKGDLLFSLQDINELLTVEAWTQAVQAVLQKREVHLGSWPDESLRSDLLALQLEMTNAWSLYEAEKKLLPLGLKKKALQEQSNILQRHTDVLEQQEQVMKNIADIALRDLSRIEALDNPRAVSPLEKDNAEITYLRYRQQQTALQAEALDNAFKDKALQLQLLDITIDQERKLRLLQNAFLRSAATFMAALQSWKKAHLYEATHEGRLYLLTEKGNGYAFAKDELVMGIQRDSFQTRALATLAFSDFGKVQIGQSVDIEIPGYNRWRYGVLEGFIDHIEPLAMNEGLQLYMRVPNSRETTKGEHLILHENMPVLATIQVKKQPLWMHFVDAWQR